MLEAYERRLNTLVTHPHFGYAISYRRIFEVQARLLGRFLTGEVPFIFHSAQGKTDANTLYRQLRHLRSAAIAPRASQAAWLWRSAAIFSLSLRPVAFRENMLIEALTPIIHHREDQVMLINLGPADGPGQREHRNTGPRA